MGKNFVIGQDGGLGFEDLYAISETYTARIPTVMSLTLILRSITLSLLSLEGMEGVEHK